MADYALQFDGSQNYLDLGTMGNFGSNLGNGFYCEFIIETTLTSLKVFGYNVDGTFNAINIFLNSNESYSTASGKINIQFQDNSGNQLVGATANSTNFNDGNSRTVIITANFSTKTITISIDGINQSINYSIQNTLSNFINLPYAFFIGAHNDAGSPTNFVACTIDNIKIGTSFSVLYGNYLMDEGSGTTTADTSGNGNTATLRGSPLPSWVSGIVTTTSTSSTSSSSTSSTSSSTSSTSSSSTSSTSSSSSSSSSTSSSSTSSTSSSSSSTSTSTTTVPFGSALLQESGSYLLQESGFKILLEPAGTTTSTSTSSSTSSSSSSSSSSSTSTSTTTLPYRKPYIDVSR